jgi:hypothetical protein
MAARLAARSAVAELLKAALVDGGVIAVPRNEVTSKGVQGGGGRATGCC